MKTLKFFIIGLIIVLFFSFFIGMFGIPLLAGITFFFGIIILMIGTIIKAFK